MARLGIKLFDNTIKLIGYIDTNQPLETTVTTIIENQEIAELILYIMNDQKLGTITIRNLPQGKAGEPRIHLQITIQEKNALAIKATLNNAQEYLLQVPGEWNKNTVYRNQHIAFSNLAESTIKNNIASYQLSQTEHKRFKHIFIIVVSGLLIFLLMLSFFSIPIRFASLPAVKKLNNRLQALPVAAITTTNTVNASPQPTMPLITIAAATSTVSATNTPLQTATQTPLTSSRPPILASTLVSQLKALQPLYFYPDSIDMLPESQEKLKQLTAFLATANNPRLNLIITGHAAESGTSAGQMLISLNRAQFIRDELISHATLTIRQCTIRGKGNTAPLYTGTEIEKQYLNRRVEIELKE